MSNSFTFAVKTDVGREELYSCIRELWSGDYVSVDTCDGRALICTLSYYFGGDEQESEIRKVVDLLFFFSSDEFVRYYRCSETWELAIESATVLTVDDLFRDEYQPKCYDGIQYFFRVR